MYSFELPNSQVTHFSLHSLTLTANKEHGPKIVHFFVCLLGDLRGRKREFVANI